MTLPTEPFRYANTPFSYAHGPSGYVNYQSFKPFLRDDFSYRCFFCLTRERWAPQGHEEFSVDHVQPQSIAPERMNDYNNLLYACCSCNRIRQASPLPLDITDECLADHVEVDADGSIAARTATGRALIRMCRLDRPLLTASRKRVIKMLDVLIRLDSHEATELVTEILGWPVDLPNLRTKKPPGGNVKPEGIASCCYERRQCGELPALY